MPKTVNVGSIPATEGSEFEQGFSEFRDAMITISDLTVRIAHGGAGGLNADHVAAILDAADVLKLRGGPMLDWLVR